MSWPYTRTMLLIFPPIAKACEPPAGIARLAGALQANNIPCRLWDANLEGQLWLLEQPPTADDTWTRRAARHCQRNLALLRSPDTYHNMDRYPTAVRDLNRVLAMAGTTSAATLGLADYRHAERSPLRSADLLWAAENPRQNPFFTFFNQRLPQLLDGISTVGISLNYLSQALTTFGLIGLLRQQYPQLKVVLGGGLVGSWLARPDWRNPFDGLVDQLIAGPGEGPLLELLGATQPVNNGLPAYDQLPLQDYLSPALILPYSAAAGCWWNRCSFCPERAEGNRYQPLPARQALSELQTLVARHQPRLLHLLDNAISPALLRLLAETPPGAPWYGFARFDEQLADLAFCRALRESGCVLLKLGLESGDQGVLDRLSKGIDLGIAGQVLKNLQTVGIGVYCYLLFGTPAEDEAAARRTLDFVARHAEQIGFLNLAIFNMPAFGDEASQYATEPFYEGDLQLYTSFRHPSGWERSRVRRFLSQEFTRHPAIAPIVRCDPPLFTSNHAPLWTTS